MLLLGACEVLAGWPTWQPSPGVRPATERWAHLAGLLIGLDDVAALRASVPVALPLALFGVLLGNCIAARVPPQAIKRGLALLLMLSGLALMRRFGA